MTSRLALLAAAALALAPAFAAAESATPAPVLSTQSAGGPALAFTLRGGVATAPDYFGADSYTVGPDLGFSPSYLRFGRFEFGDPDPWAARQGLAPRGSLRYIPERDSGEFSELENLDDIDAALELGLGLGYTQQNSAIWLDVRRGFGGHEAWVAELGADYISRPSDRLAVTFGPRMFFGSDDYADTYFGVSAAEAAASPSYAAYDPEGGLLSAGLELGMRYRLTDVWGVEGAVSWDRFTNDALDSPIVQQGSQDQWGARLAITRAVRLGR
ncbi:MipA/OmpV family protein [Roseivivax sp. CAU 1761]